MTRNARREAVRVVEAELRAAAARRAARSDAVRRWVQAGALEEGRPSFVARPGENDPFDLTDAQRALGAALLTGVAWPGDVPIADRQVARAELLQAAVLEREGDELRVARGAALLAVDACAPRVVSITASAPGHDDAHVFRLAITAAVEVLSVRSPSDGRRRCLVERRRLAGAPSPRRPGTDRASGPRPDHRWRAGAHGDDGDRRRRAGARRR